MKKKEVSSLAKKLKKLMALWFALLFVSGGALVGTGLYGKKKKRFIK